MPKHYNLPPAPEHPVFSPPFLIAGEKPISIEGFSGEPVLEGLVRIPENPTRAIVITHPHPLYGGSMHSAVPIAVAKVLAEKAPTTAVLRFNYRGIGKSEGSYDEGRGETFDARAAIRELRGLAPNVPLALCGYSFGTWVGLRAAAMERNVDRVALIAPAVRIFEFVKEDADSLGAPIAIFVGDEDEFVDVDEARALATTIGATIQIFEGNEHYFLKGRRKLAEAVVPFLVPELTQTV